MVREEQGFGPQVRGPASPVDKDERNLFTWSGGPGGVTEGDEYTPTLVIQDGYPIEYSCGNKLVEWSHGEWTDNESGRIHFQFDYEIILNEMPVWTFEENLREFEWSLLWNVAKELGIDNCNFTEAISHSATGAEYFFMIGNEFKDEEVLETCFPSSCRPERSFMTAKHTGTAADKTAAERLILETVQNVMRTNATHVKDISNVVYVGDRESWPRHAPLIADEPKSVPVKTFGWAVGGALAFALAATVLVGFLVRSRVHTTHLKKETETISGCRSMDISEIEVDLESMALEGAQDGVINKTDDVEKASTTASEENPDDFHLSQEQSNLIVPVAPTSVSLPSKRKRRRKKKKKKKKAVMTLSRSNSLSSMDTIEEVREEEEVDEGSEYGSEYSTDDEDSLRSSIRNSTSTASLSIDAAQAKSTPLEQVVESPRIRKLPPPWI